MKNINTILDTYRIIEWENDGYFDETFTRGNRLFGLKDLLDYFGVNKEWDICEIGSYAGTTAKLFAYYGKTVYCVDIWEEYITPYDRAIMVKNIFDIVKQENQNIVEIKNYSEIASKTFIDKSIDLIYIDGDHSYESVKNDILNWIPKLKFGGVMSGHDYCESPVKRAVDEYFGENKIKYFEDSSWAIKI